MEIDVPENETMNEQIASVGGEFFVPAATRQTSLHFLENEALLFDKARQSLYGLNATAAFIWCCLEDGMDARATIDSLQTTFALSPEQAREQLGCFLDQWRMLTPRDGSGEPLNLKSLMPPMQLADFPGSAMEDRDIGTRRNYRILDIDVAIRYAARSLEKAAHPFIAHFETGPGASPDVELAVIPDGDDVVFVTGEREIDRCSGVEHLTAYTKMCLLLVALDRSADFCAVHAAALETAGRGLLLPGRSQSGKSTLAAALAAAGFGFLGDDTIVLAADTLDARAVPFGISVKDGAWNLLASRFPCLPDLPIHVRPDGKRVRYLLPDALRLESHVPVKWIVFPEYSADAHAELVPVSRPAALSQLLSGVTALGDGLTSAKVDRLVQWIGRTECYVLRLSALEPAVALLADLCR